MPIIATGKAALQSSIKAAFDNAKASGQEDGANPDEITSALSDSIANAVDAYVTSIVVQINPGGLTLLGDTIVTPQTS
jgi:hypothetical protein